MGPDGTAVATFGRLAGVGCDPSQFASKLIGTLGQHGFCMSKISLKERSTGRFVSRRQKIISRSADWAPLPYALLFRHRSVCGCKSSENEGRYIAICTTSLLLSLNTILLAVANGFKLRSSSPSAECSSSAGVFRATSGRQALYRDSSIFKTQ